jgi:hypothetical protein
MNKQSIQGDGRQAAGAHTFIMSMLEPGSGATLAMILISPFAVRFLPKFRARNNFFPIQ